ncbi:MAG: GlsB/YeaQ/YmgE family stress response membrane protein [Bauldia sp.]|nr:GlsB/YeaQ/YmgE family stress response membrane protein [Bauldia sp.]
MSNETVRNVLVWVVLGILAGWIASLIVGGASGLVGFLIAGLVGSVVGGFLARQFNIRLNLGSAFVEQIIISVIGAIVVLIVWQIIT